MSIEGLQRAQGRIAEIQSRISTLGGGGLSATSTGWGPGLHGAGTGSQGSFNNAYQVALAQTQTAGSYTGASLGLSGSSAVDALTPATLKAVGTYGRLDPPPELAAYGNGRVPASALVPLGSDGHKLYAPAATAWKRMVADAADDGVAIGLTDSYRSYPQQVDLANRKGLYNQGGWAATPGTSNHGWGMAVDVDVDEAGQQWMRSNAWRYGWVESVPREPWHWEFRPTT